MSKRAFLQAECLNPVGRSLPHTLYTYNNNTCCNLLNQTAVIASCLRPSEQHLGGYPRDPWPLSMVVPAFVPNLGRPWRCKPSPVSPVGKLDSLFIILELQIAPPPPMLELQTGAAPLLVLHLSSQELAGRQYDKPEHCKATNG